MNSKINKLEKKEILNTLINYFESQKEDFKAIQMHKDIQKYNSGMAILSLLILVIAIGTMFLTVLSSLSGFSSDVSISSLNTALNPDLSTNITTNFMDISYETLNNTIKIFSFH